MRIIALAAILAAFAIAMANAWWWTAFWLFMIALVGLFVRCDEIKDAGQRPHIRRVRHRRLVRRSYHT